MIHNLRSYVNDDSKKLYVQFTVITEIGSCLCIVHMDDKDKDDRPKLFADSYEVLGVPYIQNRIERTNAQDRLFTEGIKRIGRTVQEICDNNGWNCWSF